MKTEKTIEKTEKTTEPKPRRQRKTEAAKPLIVEDPHSGNMTVRANEVGGPRLGLAIAARTIGNAIARNRLRLEIRESFRHAQHRLPPADIIVGAKVGARTAPDALRRQSLAGLWNKIASQCAPSSAS